MKYPEISEDALLSVDIELKEHIRVSDVYRDKSTEHRILNKQDEKKFTTASPFFDSKIALRLKLEGVKGDERKTIFNNYDKEEKDGFLVYNMDYFNLPSVFRKILKISKKHE